MKTEINYRYKEIPQQELIELDGGVYVPIGRFGNLILVILSFLTKDDIL
ncbi:MAG: hypothetical protein KAS71_13435 [Bacteroidales bacterium]|nr:hypothetical protein [Bacteroidales bacterium]